MPRALLQLLAMPLVLGLALIIGAARAEAMAAPHLQHQPCWFPTPAEAIPAECGALVTPESPDLGSSVTLTLPYVLFHQNPDAPVLVYIAGGPGDPLGLDADGIRLWRQRLAHEPWLAGRDVLLMDQRGTGLARPTLACPELAGIGARILAQDWPESRQISAWTGAARQCRARLLRAGLHLDRYHGAAIAGDLRTAMMALGRPHWDLYGVSYGTRIALILARDVMRIAPDRLHSVILDSALPADTASYDLAGQNLAAAIASLGPDTARDLTRALDRARHHALRVTLALPGSPIPPGLLILHLDAAKLGEVIEAGFYSRSGILALPGLLAELAAGRDDGLAQAALPVYADYQAQDFSYGLFLSVECHDEYPFNRLRDPALRRKLAGPLASFIRANLPLILCPVWPAGQAGPALRDLAPLPVPVLVLAGALDPVTPAISARHLADRLGQARFMVLAGLGHGVVVNSPCAQRLVQEFLADPGKPVPVSAMAKAGSDSGFCGGGT